MVCERKASDGYAFKPCPVLSITSVKNSEFPHHAIEQQKPDMRECILYNSIYIKIRGKINHNQIVVLRVRGGEWGDR